jgi:hypothetical protein
MLKTSTTQTQLTKNMKTEISFTQIVSAFGPVFRASFKECRLELSLEKDHLQVIDENSKHDSYRVIDGQCEYENSDDENNTVCENWTEQDWAELHAAILAA